MELKKKITATAIFCSVLLTQSLSFAFDYDIQYDYANQNVIISGTPDNNGDFMSLQILKDGKNFETAKDEDFIYTGQRTADKSFNFEFDYTVSMGKYPARIATSASSEKKDFNLLIISRSDLDKLYKELNELSKTDEKAFKEKVNKNIEYLAQVEGIKAVSDSELDNYLEYVKENELKIDKSAENAKIFNTFMIIEDLNNEKIENFAEKINQTYTSDKLLKDFEELCDEEKIAEYFTEKMSGKSVKTLDNYEKVFKQALILTAANYGSGYGELERLAESYGKDAGLTKNYSSYAFKKVFGSSYSDIDDLESALSEVKESDKSSGGGSSSSGGGSKGSNKNMSISTNKPIGNNVEKMEIMFDDIDGVEWASVSILGLADRGIVSGKEPRKFAPMDNVTREEFVKILIGAMNLQDSGYKKNNFTDVPDGAWYVSYVNIAYENGIVNGIGNYQFGTGANITRQDMVVMLYNALKHKNAEITTKALDFEDSDKIADYAKEAVSALYGMGAVNGVSATEFDPLSTATRAQAAKVIYGVINYLS